ncbi:DUF3160 domain-containing protein [Caproicibacter sp.]|uniref:DUF3160 domain-containing protein n=1 Tax=Caproicibacter sp. TaxID=2814884 RepID=UPI0039895D9C
MFFRRTMSSVLCCAFLLAATGCGAKGTTTSRPAVSVDGTESKTVKSTAFRLVSLESAVNKNVAVPYSPSQFVTKVEPYKVNPDLSNIDNLKQFGSFSEGEKKLLSQNAFMVSPTAEEQLFYLYEKNSYLEIPSFITADSVLQLYHIFYDFSLRNLEKNSLFKAVDDLTGSMLKKSVQIYKGVQNPEVKAAALKNIAYFAAAELGLGKALPQETPDEAKNLAEKEYSLIQAKQGYSQSAIFPFELDYSQFEPRGHYTRNDDFKRYFTAMMWYGQAPFPLYKDKDQKERDVEQTLQALLVTYALFMEKDGTQDITNWEEIYAPTSFYVGASDDLTIYDYRDLLRKVYGDQPNLETLSDGERLDALYQEAKTLPEPRIAAKYTQVNTPVGKQLRLMGQRYLADSEMIQELVEPIQRPIPSGLDVMGVLGSDRAYQIQLSKQENQWKGYPAKFTSVRAQFSKLPEETWRSNLYYGWLWVLKGLTQPYGNGYPSFMTNRAWTDKSLNTALGSWSELRHDTILYGKQSGAEKGGGEEPKVLGYVEPAVEVYDKLLWLTQYSRENLSARNLLTGENEEGKNNMEGPVKYLEDLLQFLRDCSVKELKGEQLTDDEYARLYDYGENMEEMTASFATDGLRWFEIESETDKNMALVADFHTIAPNQFDQGGYLEAGVGPAHAIYVVVPIGGKLYLTRGAVFSYYEFESDKRLTDEQWQKMLKENKAPAQPSWTRSFISGGKGKIPEPQDPYNS